MNATEEIVGVAATVVGTFLMVPQLYRSITTRRFGLFVGGTQLLLKYRFS